MKSGLEFKGGGSLLRRKSLYYFEVSSTRMADDRKSTGSGVASRKSYCINSYLEKMISKLNRLKEDPNCNEF